MTQPTLSIRKPLLLGFAFTGFRSFGSDHLEAIGPMRAVHLLAGPNNAGKSSALAVVEKALLAFRDGSRPSFEVDDAPLVKTAGDAPRQLRISILVDPGDWQADQMTPEDWDELGQLLGKASLIRPEVPGIWLDFDFDGPQARNSWAPSLEQVERLVALGNSDGDVGEGIGRLARQVTGQRAGGVSGNSQRIFDALIQGIDVRATLPNIETIGAFRRIGPAEISRALWANTMVPA
jgi:hypothetical protein